MEKARIELVDAIKELEDDYREIVSLAIESKLITLEEWNERFKHYRDEVGYSFIHYLECIRNKLDAFITLNTIMLENSLELENRFGVKIIAPGELKNERKKNNLSSGFIFFSKIN